jgi:hypothetical protein
VFSLIACQEALKNSHDHPSPHPTNPFAEGLSFYMHSDEAKLAQAFVVVWLTYKSSRSGNSVLTTESTWPLVRTILSHEFTSIGILNGKRENRGGGGGRRQEEKNKIMWRVHLHKYIERKARKGNKN